MPYTNGVYTSPGWVNGGPPPLNASNLNDISNALEDATKSMVIDHKNLLDNPYWISPINQMGETTVTIERDGSSGIYIPARVIDRWWGDDGATYTLEDDGIKCVARGNMTIAPLNQQLVPDDLEQLLGKTVTFSVIYKAYYGNVHIHVTNQNGTIEVESGAGTASDSWALYTRTLTIPEDSTELKISIYFFNQASSGQDAYGKFCYAKMEFGDESTAFCNNPDYFESPDIPPIWDVPEDRGIELLKCQRCFMYFKSFKKKYNNEENTELDDSPIGIGFMTKKESNLTQASTVVKLPTKIYKEPILSFGGVFMRVFFTASEYADGFAISNIEMQNFNGDEITLITSVNQTVTPRFVGDPIYIFTKGDGWLSLDTGI